MTAISKNTIFKVQSIKIRRYEYPFENQQVFFTDHFAIVSSIEDPGELPAWYNINDVEEMQGVEIISAPQKMRIGII